jgi:nicotinate-nucleotide adenylyltransferase
VTAAAHVGILGGSFDPPHTGHLLVAQDAHDALAVDRLLVIPAATQPLKGAGHATAHDRLAMARLAFADLPGIEVDPVEVDRGGISFMVDTVEHLRRRLPSAVLHLLVGEDVVPTLPRWRDADRLLAMVRLVILQRGLEAGAGPAVPNRELLPGVAGAVRLATRRVDVSSTEVRARVRDGRSIRGFVPDAVARYITDHALYQGEPPIADPPTRA